MPATAGAHCGPAVESADRRSRNASLILWLGAAVVVLLRGLIQRLAAPVVAVENPGATELQRWRGSPLGVISAPAPGRYWLARCADPAAENLAGDALMSCNSAAIARLRARLDTSRPAIAMAAHNPLAAKLAAAAGFDAVWGSGFELSASYAVPDANILPVGTHLEMMRAIGEVQDAPVIADLDTGYGNAVNVAYLVPRYAAAGVAAVVIEDKTFPKDSSLRPSGRQDLVPAEEFQGKIEAARIAGGPLVVARTEALIAGLGQAEAVRRGVAYAEAGADAVLVHSRQTTPDEILEFCRAWHKPVPLALVPTAYPQLSFAEIANLGKVGLVICANHAVRAAVAAMRTVFARILAEGGIAGVESTIAPVAEIFALQGDARMRELEARFLR